MWEEVPPTHLQGYTPPHFCSIWGLPDSAGNSPVFSKEHAGEGTAEPPCDHHHHRIHGDELKYG